LGQTSCAGEELVGYVSLEEGVGCGVWRNG